MLTLTPAQRRFLRAQAHSLHPVVMIGDAGLSESVMREIECSLKSHELIKVKVAGDDRELREQWLAHICETLHAAPVQHIGKTLVVYRPADKPKLALPKLRK
jgi:RNA-binding protein